MLLQLALHVNLALLFCSKQFTAPQQWAHIIWAYARALNHPYFYKDEMLQDIVQRSGRVELTVERWLRAGIELGLFIEGQKDGRTTYAVVGKHRIFKAYLDGHYPGIAALIDADILFKSTLQELRAWLLFTFTADGTHIRSRINMASSLDRTEQTTINYSKAIKQPKRATYLIANIPGKAPEAFQKPNKWLSSKFFNTRTPTTRKRHMKYKATVKPTHTKLYFDNVHAAAKASAYRAAHNMDPIVYHFSNTIIHSNYTYLHCYNVDMLHQH